MRYALGNLLNSLIYVSPHGATRAMYKSLEQTDVLTKHNTNYASVSSVVHLRIHDCLHHTMVRARFVVAVACAIFSRDLGNGRVLYV